MVQQFLSEYWGVISFFVGGIIYILTHQQLAKTYAKSKAKTIMFAAESKAESLALKYGAEKFQWVVSNGYDLLPSPVRVFVSKPLFESIVQGLFDEAVAFAKAHMAAPEQPNPAPVATDNVQTVATTQTAQ